MRKPAERRWTVMVVPHGSGVSRAVELSQTVVKAVVGISSVLVLLVLVLGSAAIARGGNITRSRALEHENHLLADEVEAAAAGVVTDVGWEDGYGNMLTIDHGYGLVTRFAHCSRIFVVRGTRVKRGQKIALVGSTGLATGPHLHYEVWVNGKPVDPLHYVLPDAIVD